MTPDVPKFTEADASDKVPPLHRTETKYLIVTPGQFSDGYLEKTGFVAFHRSYQLVRRQSDGNFLVVDPTQST